MEEALDLSFDRLLMMMIKRNLLGAERFRSLAVPLEAGFTSVLWKHAEILKKIFTLFLTSTGIRLQFFPH